MPSKLEIEIAASNRMKEWLQSSEIKVHDKGTTPNTTPNTTHFVQLSSDVDAVPIYKENQMDKYDRAIEYLTANPHLIKEAWVSPKTTLGGSLFAFKTGLLGSHYCPSMMAAYSGLEKSEIEKQLLVEIPTDGARVAVEHLPLFAAVQRHWDSLGLEREELLQEY